MKFLFKCAVRTNINFCYAVVINAILKHIVQMLSEIKAAFLICYQNFGLKDVVCMPVFRVYIKVSEISTIQLCSSK